MLGLGVGIDRRLVYNLDWVLLGTSLLLSLLGAAMVYSATQAGSTPGLYVKQLTLVGVGVVAMALAAAIDYRRLADRAVLLYVMSVLALVYVLRFAPVIAGTRRWIVIAGFQLQPSELVKLAAADAAAHQHARALLHLLGGDDGRHGPGRRAHEWPPPCFSPASTRTDSRFSRGGSGQVAKRVNAQGGL